MVENEFLILQSHKPVATKEQTKVAAKSTQCVCRELTVHLLDLLTNIIKCLVTKCISFSFVYVR
jgi:hypothetical protein